MKRKTLCLLLCTALILSVIFCAAADDTVLPLDLRFGMTPEEAAPLLDELHYDESGDMYLMDRFFSEVPGIVGTLDGVNVSIGWTTNNSDRAMQLDSINLELPHEGNVIASFRKALAEYTAVYGAPDEDPFLDVDGYRDYGSLSAYWTRDDARISLTMSRMYGDMLSSIFVRRQCYNEADLYE